MSNPAKPRRKYVTATIVRPPKKQQHFVFFNEPNSGDEMRTIGKFLSTRFKGKEITFVTSEDPVAIKSMRILQEAMARAEQPLQSFASLNRSNPPTKLDGPVKDVTSTKITGEVVIILVHSQFAAPMRLPLEVARFVARNEFYFQLRLRLSGRVNAMIPQGDVLEVNPHRGTCLFHKIASKKEKLG
ncbi:MAG: hypothetical protein V4664_01465 [Patescibacteria group bacterium]